MNAFKPYTVHAFVKDGMAYPGQGFNKINTYYVWAQDENQAKNIVCKKLENSGIMLDSEVVHYGHSDRDLQLALETIYEIAQHNVES